MDEVKLREAAERAADKGCPSHLWDGFVAGFIAGRAEGRAPLVALLREARRHIDADVSPPIGGGDWRRLVNRIDAALADEPTPEVANAVP